MNKIFSLIICLISFQSISQKFYLGDRLNPHTSKFKLLGISSSTGVSTYKFAGKITDKYYYNRRIGEVIIGTKEGLIVTTIYNLIPEKDDVGVPKSLIDLVQSAIPFPLAERNEIWGANIDNMSISLSRSNNALTEHKDRIMFFTSIRSSLLRNK